MNNTLKKDIQGVLNRHKHDKELQPGFKSQTYIKTCLDCKSFSKYGTTRLERENENLCSVCGKPF